VTPQAKQYIYCTMTAQWLVAPWDRPC